jgi:GDSL-like lipase/acylhydrolase family protein
LRGRLRRPSRPWAAKAILVVASLTVSLLGAEGAYRVWLKIKLERLAAPVAYDPEPSFGVYNPPPWRFDREAGFAYVPGLVWWTAEIRGGTFIGCTSPHVMTNPQGNIGKIIGSYADAEVKILLFGDSFATMHFDGDTWPNLFQRKLERALGKRVHVVNFGRDSYGILQMVDLAAREFPRWKPDYVMITFITNDLVRPRSWRVIREVNGYWRFVMATHPDEHVVPGATTTNEVAIVNPKLTREWCDRIMAQMAAGDATVARADPLVRELIEQYNVIRHENPRAIIVPGSVDFWTMRTSFLYNRLVLRDTFADGAYTRRRVGYGVIDLEDFRVDEQFERAARAIRSSGVKTLLVHLPVRPEIERGSEYLWREGGMTRPRQGPGLVRSLEEAFSASVIELNGHLKAPIRDFVPYIQSPSDWHPNASGIDLYANAVTQAVIGHAFAGPADGRRRPQ